MVRTKRPKPQQNENMLRKQPKKETPASSTTKKTRQRDVNQPTLTQMAREAASEAEVISTTGVASFPPQPIITSTTTATTGRNNNHEGDNDDEFNDALWEQNAEGLIALVEAAEKEHQRRTSSMGGEGSASTPTTSQSTPSKDGLTQDTTESAYHPNTDERRRNQAVESSDDEGDNDSTGSDCSDERWTQRPVFQCDDEDEESDDGKVLDEIGEEPEDSPEETNEFLQTFTQYHDQDEVCERMDRNEVWLSQQSNNAQSQRDGFVESFEPVFLHHPGVAPTHTTSLLQTSVADYFTTPRVRQPKSVPHDAGQSVEITDSLGIRRIFKVGETYGVKGTLAKEDAVLNSYYFHVACFEKLSGRVPRWGGKYDRKCGVFKDLRGTFIGEEQADKLAKSPLFKNIRKSDRCKVTQVNGCSHLQESKPIRLGLLGGPLNRKPNPHLLYEAHGKSINDFHHAYFFYRSDAWTFQKFEGEIRALDLFSGVGGMDLGLEMAGIRVTHAIDKRSRLMASFGNYAREKFRKKGEADVKVFDECVYDFLENAQKVFNEFQESNGAALDYPKPGEIDHIHSSSPCQGFSSANIHGGKNDKSNNMLIFVVILYVRFYRPKTVSFENVPGLLSGKNRHYLQKLLRLFVAEGYQVRALTMNAAQYGDPQHRLRVILFASRDDQRIPDPPRPTHGPGTDHEFVKVEEAFKGLEDIEPSKSSKRILIENGTKAVFNHCEDRRTICKEDKTKKLKGGCPAVTILCQRPVLHPTLNRPITCRERARAQSFPDDFRFFGTHSDNRNSIGNAVPVKLATAIGRAIRDSYDHRLKMGVVECYFSKERRELDRDRCKGFIAPLTQSCLLTTKK
eukprot:scaffold23288_cov171-Amphora_coffeaeformis.AAC.1